MVEDSREGRWRRGGSFKRCDALIRVLVSMESRDAALVREFFDFVTVESFRL